MRRNIITALAGLILIGSASAQDCVRPNQEFIAELKSFLTNGTGFEEIAAVKSDSHRNIYYVAVQLEVPGASGWALFASNTIEGFGQMYAVDDIANEFSSLLDGRQTRGDFSASDPAARRARACVD